MGLLTGRGRLPIKGRDLPRTPPSNINHRPAYHLLKGEFESIPDHLGETDDCQGLRLDRGRSRQVRRHAHERFLYWLWFGQYVLSPIGERSGARLGRR